MGRGTGYGRYGVGERMNVMLEPYGKILVPQMKSGRQGLGHVFGGLQQR